MKFFGEISEFNIESNRLQIKIPHYHRAATGLLSNTYVYTIPRISERNNFKILEIIVTPYSPFTWNNLYRIEIESDDKPGVINIVTEILSKLSLNIYIQESLTTEQDSLHKVSLIVDIKDLMNIEEVLRSNAVEYLKKIIIDNLPNEEEIQIQEITPLEFLHGNHIDSNPKNFVKSNELRNYFWQGFRSIPIIDKSISISDSVLHDLGLVNSSLKPDRTINGTIVSDTEEKYVLIRFFDPKQFVVYLDIWHENVIGRIHEFTTKISEIDEGYNILSCYNRVEDVKNNAHWYVMLDVSSNPSKLIELIKCLEEKVKGVSKVEVIEYTNNFRQEGINLPESTTLKNRRQKIAKDLAATEEAKRQVTKQLRLLKRRELQYKSLIKSNSTLLIINSSLIVVLAILAIATELPEFWRYILKGISVLIAITTFTAAILTIRNRLWSRPKFRNKK